MKKIALVVGVYLMIALPVLASGLEATDFEEFQNNDNYKFQESDSEGDQLLETAVDSDSAKVRNAVAEKKQEMETARLKMKKSDQEIYRSQNNVNEAAAALREIANFSGSLGERISALASEFENSLEKTIPAEQKIKAGWRITKAILGGEKKSAMSLLQTVSENQSRARELINIKSTAELSDSMNQLVDEQIQKIESENERLNALAEKEIKNKGFFGWIINLFKK
ncbi:hypothetical protein KKC32_04290 [Patescibacteria group bacterium]|nr:hypothetical protein [Patescibacteria group bacterium]